jgi:hypothetical protein
MQCDGRRVSLDGKMEKGAGTRQLQTAARTSVLPLPRVLRCARVEVCVGLAADSGALLVVDWNTDRMLWQLLLARDVD